MMWLAVLTISQFALLASSSEPGCTSCQEDEISLLQVYSGLNPKFDGSYEQMDGAPVQPHQQASFNGMPVQDYNMGQLDAATAGLERQLQDVQMRAGASEAPLSTLQASSEVAALKNMVQDLQSQNQAQAGQLTGTLEQQRLANDAVDHAKMQLQKQIATAQQAWQSEQNARESERRALKALAEEADKDKALEDKVRLTNEEVQQMVQQRQTFSKKLVLLETEAEKVKQHEHKAYELSMSQAKQSEKKAWEVAKKEAQKAVEERKLKETLLAQAKTELSHMKDHVNSVQAQAAQALTKEVQQVDQKVNEVKQEANAELRKASDQLHREHDEVKSVVAYANKVQQDADAKVMWAKSAQKQVASQVNWAAVAQREAARASAAIEQLEELKAASAKN